MFDVMLVQIPKARPGRGPVFWRIQPATAQSVKRKGSTLFVLQTFCFSSLLLGRVVAPGPSVTRGTEVLNVAF